jgi:hypothetical protein
MTVSRDAANSWASRGTLNLGDTRLLVSAQISRQLSRDAEG